MTSSSSPLNLGSRARRYTVKILSMGMVRSSMPRFPASARASLLLSSLVYLEGMKRQVMFSLPRASSAMTVTRAESMPPLRAMRACEKPFLSV